MLCVFCHKRAGSKVTAALFDNRSYAIPGTSNELYLCNPCTDFFVGRFNEFIDTYPLLDEQRVDRET